MTDRADPVPSPLPRSPIYSRNEGVMRRVVAGETVLVPLREGLGDMRHVFSLNGPGGDVWEWLDGETPLGAVADRLMQVYRVDRDVAEADLAELVNALETAGLIRRVAG